MTTTKHDHSFLIAGNRILVACSADDDNKDEPLTGMVISRLVERHLSEGEPTIVESVDLMKDLYAALKMAEAHVRGACLAATAQGISVEQEQILH